MGTIGRRTRAALLTTVVAATTAVGAGGGAAPASAQAPERTVTVTPSTGLRDGDTVEVTTAGLSTSDIFAVVQCDASALANLHSAFEGPCALKSIRLGGGEVDTVTVNVTGSFRGGDGSVVRCGDEPEDCAIISWSPTGWHAGALIDMEPTAVAVPSPEQEVDYPVEVFVTGPDGIGATAQLAQCKVPVGPDAASSQCSPLQPVALDPDGNAVVTFTLVAEVGEPAYACGELDCAVTLFDDAGTVLGAAAVIVDPDDGPPRMSSYDLGDASDGAFVGVDVTGIRNESVDVAQCDASVADTQDVVGGPCTPASHWEGTLGSGATSFYLLLETAFTGTDGTEVTCLDNDDCVLALEGSSGAFSTLPISWNVPDTLNLSPADGLVDGDEVTVTAGGLRPDGGYRVARCGPDALLQGGLVDQFSCEGDVTVIPSITASPEGTLTTTIDAAQRLTTAAGTDVYCRDDCLVVLLSDNYSTVTAQPYGMSPGQLSASPSSGLQDGQPVEVSWTGTQPSYDGPLWWILQTGAWAVGQCGAGILDDTSVANVFRQCITPPGGGAVTITDPDGGADVEVQATIQPAVGGPIDCTTGPEACVAVLGRVEQDASVTLLSSPLTFG